MKNITTILIALLFMVSAKAQITLSQADFGNTFFHAILANDTLVDTATIHIGNPGATSQTWNFSTLHNSNTETLQFMSPTATTYATNFPTATVAFTQSSNQGATNFINATAAGIFIVGQGLDHGYLTNTTPDEAVVLMPQQTFMAFPATYNSTFSGTSVATIVIDTSFTYSIFNVDTLHNVHYANYTSSIDAWGSVTTPFGTFPCLRQKYVEHTLDSIYAHTTTLGWIAAPFTTIDSSITYRWFANAQGFPVCEINMDKDTINHSWFASKSSWIFSSNTGIKDLVKSNSQISLFPNPATNDVNVLNASGDAIVVAIYDAMGKKITEINSNEVKTTINTSAYAAGLYSYRVVDAKNVAISTGKFSIQR